MDAVEEKLHQAARRYPRSAAYDVQWVFANHMGPNALWLMETLTECIALRPGMRVLDMGCGRALTSIFLAKEFGVRVWATDLWVGATENWERIRDAGVMDLVTPIHSEAHALPFARGFFDALLSVDAYHYFGTDDLYLRRYAQLGAPGSQIGIVVPGVVDELEGVPQHLQSYWEQEFWSFHSPSWWRRHWEHSGMVSVQQADLVPDGWADWLRWQEICVALGDDRGTSEAEMLRVDSGRTLGFTRVVATRL